MKLHLYLATALVSAAAPALFAQPTYYNGTNATGQLVLTRTVNLKTLAQSAQALGGFSGPEKPLAEIRRTPPVLPGRVSAEAAIPPVQSLTVVSGPATVGFNGLSHYDQRMSNGGNQFSVEPPNTSIAVGKGFILEGVNNAVQVYDSTGKALLSKVLASNQVFGVPAAIDRTLGIYGVFPTDMRVFYDAGIDRWFIMQRAQDNDIFNNLLTTTHLYLAVSQTGDPTGVYNIYVMDTTNSSYPGCPCVADYPQIGADQYGVYISANQYQSIFDVYVAASILAVSKTGLELGVKEPAAYKFNIPFTVGDEFTIQPATTPPDGSYYLANGGVEYLVSSNKTSGNVLGLWALTNTSSLLTQPNLLLTKVVVPSMIYGLPPVAKQPEGPRPYGKSVNGGLPFIETGDTRALSLMYVGGRLYVALSTRVFDEAGRNLAGIGYIVVSPTLRKNALTGTVVQQGYLAVSNNYLLFPTMAVNSQGRGAIAATLVGPDWYPSAVFVPFTTFTTPTTLRVVSAGLMPEDGFTGYEGSPSRWGDYSSAVVSTDGSLWVASEYIGNLPRTEFANWQTFIAQFKP